MDSNIFRKSPSPSILRIEKTWDDVLDKPFQFDEMTGRAIGMMLAAEDFGILTRLSSLRDLKNAIYNVIIEPLNRAYGSGDSGGVPTDGNVQVDAFWDEIPGVPKELKDAIERLFLMKQRIDENINNKLDNKSTLMDAKNIVNETVLKPLNDINEDE